MAFNSYHGFRAYVPVAQRRLEALKVAKNLAGKGRALSPVHVEGRSIATTFWGQAWCRHLESYSDYANRLPRGRTYVRSRAVLDLQIAPGLVTALVQGSSLYTLTIKIDPLEAKRWNTFKKRCAGRVTNLLDLLQGRLSKEILADLTDRDAGLFPAPGEIDLGCSCLDWADMCKHVAAVLYGVGARLDREPTLLFTLRGVDVQELITAASTAATADLVGAAPGDSALADADLGAIFGVELDTGATGLMPVAPRGPKIGDVAPRAEAGRSGKPVPAAKPRPVPKAKTATAARGKRRSIEPLPAKKKAKKLRGPHNRGRRTEGA